MLGGKEFYVQWHHGLTHNFLFAVIVTALAARWIGAKPGQLARVFACMLIHFTGDYYGSGPGWALPLLVPFSDWKLLNPHAWTFNGWQSQLTLAVAAAITFVVARFWHRTPLEVVSPGMDRMFADLAVLGFSHRCPSPDCGKRALYTCHTCGAIRCGGHLRFFGVGRVECFECVAQRPDQAPPAAGG